jgi:hypothetical protein
MSHTNIQRSCHSNKRSPYTDAIFSYLSNDEFNHLYNRGENQNFTIPENSYNITVVRYFDATGLIERCCCLVYSEFNVESKGNPKFNGVRFKAI